MRLIDADAIKLEKGFFENIDNVPKFFEWLGKQPTIDPVKHGRWIDRRSIAAMNRYECSACKRMTTVDEFMGKPMYAYCPWCGAELKGEE